MRSSSPRKHNDGFTLVEVIVVLVILAILATTLIPSLTGYIDRAGNQSAVTECRGCVMAAQTLASERYAAKQTLTLDDSAAIVALADSPDGADVTALTVAAGKVTLLTYRSAGGISVTYQNGEYTVGDAGDTPEAPPPAFTNAETLTALKDTFTTVSPGAAAVDSAVAGFGGDNNKALDVQKALADAGIDLGALGATSWRYNGAGDREFIWTPADITAEGVNAGDRLPVLRYNFTRNTFTVWTASIDTSDKAAAANGQFYNTLKLGAELPASKSLTIEQKQDYETVLAVYNELSGG